MIRIGHTEEYILKEISDKISGVLNSAGIFNRVFSRLKTPSSIQKKLNIKKEEYLSKNKKMQDIFGIRVTLYFLDDEEIAIKLVKQNFIEVPEAHSIDHIDKDRFGPQRCNLVFKIEENFINSSNLFDQEMIDSTFEVQFRTVLSEGWHEVEHDLRYKCKPDWENEESLYRQLNGQLAVLETCNWAMLKIFDELAYKKYKEKQWPSLFRNILRIRFEDSLFSSSVDTFLNSKPNFAKEFIKMDRINLILPLTRLTLRVPLKMDSVFFIINRAVFKNKEIIQFEPELLKKILDESFSIE